MKLFCFLLVAQTSECNAVISGARFTGDKHADLDCVRFITLLYETNGVYNLTTVYLLFDGTSVDGRGEPEYAGKTTHIKIAKAHFEKCRKNPYSIGRVMVANDFKFFVADKDTFESV